jgi:hypothetical protein
MGKTILSEFWPKIVRWLVEPDTIVPEIVEARIMRPREVEISA